MPFRPRNLAESKRSDNRDARSQAGFTLIELLVVIIILGILAGVAVVGVSTIQGSGQSQACKVELKSVRAASASFSFENDNKAAANIGVLVEKGYLDQAPEGTYTVAANGSVTQTACP